MALNPSRPPGIPNKALLLVVAVALAVVIAVFLLLGPRSGYQPSTSDREGTSIPVPAKSGGSPSVSASGSDVCAEWKLSEPNLSACRTSWKDAITNEDRISVRSKYAPLGEAPQGSSGTEGENTAETIRTDSPTGVQLCDTWKLAGRILSECRAEFKAAKDDQDRARITEKYRESSAER
jgi:hypothetical protein